MNIACLIPEFPTQTHIFFWREFESLQRMGCELQLLSTRRPQEGRCPHKFRDEAMRRTTYVFPPNWPASLGTLLSRPGRSLCTLRLIAGLAGRVRDTPGHLVLLHSAAELLNICKINKIEHIHVHSCGNAALLTLLCKMLGGPTYSLTLHSPLSTFGPNQRPKWRNAEFAIVITRKLYEEVRRVLDKDLPACVEIASMGVDLDAFRRTTPYRPWDGSGPCYIFSCGRLNPCKGHDDLIRAIGILRDLGFDARLVIAGEDYDSGTGAYRKALEDLVRELDISDRVSLIGAVSQERVREENENAHVFSLASHQEPLGVAIMEAMAMGVPVVATSAGGVPELVQDGVSGVLVPPHTPEALAKGITRILENSELASALGAEGRQVVETRFGSDQCARMLKRCLDDLATRSLSRT
jgi:colanic acid/amylovoran biosynthesis glycosyltransferase